MSLSVEELSRRVARASETLDTEIKPWLDIRTDPGVRDIARTCIALRNNDGGVLIIGLKDDGSVGPCPHGKAREVYHSDRIQEIVSKYSSEPFEVTVHFVEHGGEDRVLIEVPSGVRTPIICRYDLPQADGGKPPRGHFLARDTIYVRTLSANDRVSTSPARSKDWPRLMENCFNNREADVGAFIRRQLSSINIETATKTLAEVLNSARAPEPIELLRGLMDAGFERFNAKRRGLRPNERDCGTLEAAAAIIGPPLDLPLTQQFMLGLNINIRRYSGWGPWVELLGPQSNGNMVDGGWESFFYAPQLFNTLELGRIEASGQMYYVEGLREDLVPEPAKGLLDFVMQTGRATEIVATALSLAKSFCGENIDRNLLIATRWKGIANRHLVSVSEPSRHFCSSKPANDQEKLTHVTVPIATAINAIEPIVLALIKPLFRLFGGWEFDDRVLAEIISKRLKGR